MPIPTILRNRSIAGLLTAGLLLFAAASAAQAQALLDRTFDLDIPPQQLTSAMIALSRQTGVEVLMSAETVEGMQTAGVTGELSLRQALDGLLAGTSLGYRVTGDRAVSIAAGPPQDATAGQNTIGQRRPGIEEIIVTGQKREERIQDVPIAISAFTQEDLTTSQIAGGPDLHLQVPNMTFTKTNFSGYSIQIRGIGTQAISATTDPAVAVALNQTPFIRNRFFEQEFYDMERVEVLRGPQGTLFGRNATAGVVNLITAKPKFQEEAMLSLDKGNYDSRRWEFMVNTPLVTDEVALRIAGAGTKRDGYATNEITGNPIDGRDLWSTRVSLRFTPADGDFDMNLIWERFEEDDDRLRSGKQLCHKDVVDEVGGISVEFGEKFPGAQKGVWDGPSAIFSQGCERGSLYSENAFQTPNGLMLPYYLPLGAIGLPDALDGPYANSDQSKDLRVIESALDPEYRARSDIGEIQIDYQVTDTLLLESETAYMTDEIYSQQDFNRFNTAPGAWLNKDEYETGSFREGVIQEGPNGGIFCDPQLGCSDRLVAVDISTAESSQFSQEFRLSSQFSGPFNFSLGANYLRYDTEDKYYVFFNSLSLIAAVNSDRAGPYVGGESDNADCLLNGYRPGDPDSTYPVTQCVYMDPNPIGSVNDQGHNYFLSRNPYHLRSYAVFGETYFNFTDNLKLTAGLRWSVDEKKAPRIPTWLLASHSVGYPVAEVIEQKWREPTGRLVLDWKPNLSFTDETLLYGSYSHGYKAGGANPPGFVRVFYSNPDPAIANAEGSATRPKTFDAEFVDAFEIGTKNTLLDGALTLNATAFYYDYEGYQISEIVDRSAFNRNFDLSVWGAELETDLWVTQNFRLGFKGGYQKTRIDDGERAVDLMDRTAGGKQFTVTEIQNPNYTGDPGEGRPRSEYVATNSLADVPADQEFFAFEDWEVVRPFPTFASSCVLPAYLWVTGAGGLDAVGNLGGGTSGGCEIAYFEGLDPVTGADYVPDPALGANPRVDYPGFNPEWAPNNGEGFFKDLGGNELPNAPNYTATITADYIVPLKGDWMATLHTDLYWQSESWWRVFNDHEFGRLDDYFTMNLAAIFANEVSGWNIMAYIKNVTNETALTGAFLFSDDTGLTTNAFLTEPRLYGVRVTKRWDGGGNVPLASRLNGLFDSDREDPFPFSLELGGQLHHYDAPNTALAPSFAEEFAPPLDVFGGAQEEDLGWGGAREIKLTWHPEDRPWSLSLGYRQGSIRDDANADAQQFTDPVCVFVGGPLEFGCDSPEVVPTNLQSLLNFSMANHAQASVRDREEYAFADLSLNRRLQFDGFNRSMVSVGLRHARFVSSTQADIRGVPNWQISTGFPANNTTHSVYKADFSARRQFEGVGPVVSWEMSRHLFGNDSAGYVDVDWSVSGGVLFGDQTTSISGTERRADFERVLLGVSGAATPSGAHTVAETTLPEIDRSNSAAVVPTLGAGLGLSYRINGASIGLGYNWERHYDVIDGGFEEHKEYDRTIDGPYLKVTFGGGS